MTNETIPSFLLKTEVPVTPTLVLDFNALLLEAINTAIKPLKERIDELENRADVLLSTFERFEDGITEEIEKVVDELEIDVQATFRRGGY